MWVVTDEKGKTVKVCYKETEAKKYAYTHKGCMTDYQSV